MLDRIPGLARFPQIDSNAHYTGSLIFSSTVSVNQNTVDRSATGAGVRSDVFVSTVSIATSNSVINIIFVPPTPLAMNKCACCSQAALADAGAEGPFDRLFMDEQNTVNLFKR